MTKSLPDCLECRHFAIPGDSYDACEFKDIPKCRCLKGHAPRFILAEYGPWGGNGGWKRNCNDRENLAEGEPNPTIEKDREL